MSTNKQTNPAYISHVHLKGYKSIIDTEVELHPGLNIIIGPNGSGKTNFLEFLLSMFQIQYPYFETEFDNKLNLSIRDINYIWRVKFSGVEYNEESEEFEKEISEWIYPENKPNGPLKLTYSANSPFNPGNQKTRDILYPNFYPISYVSFLIPKGIKGLDEYLGISIGKKTLKIENSNNSNYIKFVDNFLSENFYNGKFKKLNVLKKEHLISKILVNEEIKRNLKKFSPIQNVRVNENFLLNENSHSYLISSLTFEFYVNGEWLLWPMLSDGTKRLFYIITEITLKKGLAFVEEPEIGVHPNQYRKILTFLKEQSEHKQIIITTHAPKTLDILEDNELDLIILTSHKKELGTKMRHLSEEEQAHAVKFMEEESFFLSDFWTLTSFFDEEEEVI